MSDNITEKCPGRVYADIDLNAIYENMENMHKNLTPGTGMIAVIKADGYGHGALPIANKLKNLEYLWGFAVATFEEAMELREGGIRNPILILGYVFPDCYEELIRNEIRIPLFREDTLLELTQAAQNCKKNAIAHIAVDTAMSRIGILTNDKGLDFALRALQTPGITVEGIFTHFSKADEVILDNTYHQLEEFTKFCDRVQQRSGFRTLLRHCSNSAGILRLPSANMDLVRAGIALYGLWPSAEVPREPVMLLPALSLHSHVVYVKEVPCGTAISYGGTYVTNRNSVIATIPVGYGDGYSRGLSNKGFVLIHGKRAPIVGRVCMDQFMVDVSDIPGVREGDPVTLIGTDHKEHISMEELGDLSGRFNYEFACCLGRRIPRIYKGQET